ISRISASRGFADLICTPHTLLSAALSCTTTPVAPKMSVPMLMTAATPPPTLEAREKTPAMNCALSDPMRDSNSLWISAREWSCPKTRPVSATTSRSRGAREKIVKKAIDAARTQPLSAISSTAEPKRHLPHPAHFLDLRQRLLSPHTVREVPLQRQAETAVLTVKGLHASAR